MKIRPSNTVKGQHTKASLFRKVIDFLLWGGLFLCFVLLQHRYYKQLLIKAPISLVPEENATRSSSLKPIPAYQNSSEKTSFITLNELDRMVQQIQQQKPQDTERIRKLDVFTIDLNRIDSISLEALPGIGPYTTRKILQYRERLGGFISKLQLLEIPYIDTQLLYQPNLRWYVDTQLVRKFNLADLQLQTWYKHPYIGKEKAKLIQQYVKAHQGMNKTQFQEMKSLSSTEKARIYWYLRFQ